MTSRLRENLKLVIVRILKIIYDFKCQIRISKIYTNKLDSAFAISATKQLVQAERDFRRLIQGNNEYGEAYLDTMFTPTLKLFVQNVKMAVRGDFCEIEKRIVQIRACGIVLLQIIKNAEGEPIYTDPLPSIPLVETYKNKKTQLSEIKQTQQKTWECQHCCKTNRDTSIMCIFCNKLHPNADVSGTPLNNKSHHSKKFWKCAKCTFCQNSIKVSSCGLCGTYRDTFTSRDFNCDVDQNTKGKSIALPKLRTIKHKDSVKISSPTRAEKASKQIG